MSSNNVIAERFYDSSDPDDGDLESGDGESKTNGREARNRAEKNRRDKLNNSIQELSGMVPHVAESPRRVDKTAVLRFSAHGLRIEYVFGKTPTSIQNLSDSSTDAFLKLLNGFLMTVTCRGQIVLVSSSVEQYLGHCQTDLYGQSLLNFTHPEDHAFLKQKLVPTNLATLFESRLDENGDPAIRTQEEEDEIDKRLSEDRRNFTIRLARAGPRSEPTIYEVVRVDGCFRRADAAPRGVKANSLSSGLQLIRRSRGRDDTIPLHTMSANDIILVAVAHVVKPPSIQSRLIEGLKYEFKTRHLIDGRIVQVDQRISLVAGYMTSEVEGHSSFGYMHKDDVRWVMVALRQMYDYRRQEAESCYRLVSRSGEFIYLKTRGFLEIEEQTNQVRSFICVNTLVSNDEGRRLIREMKRKFAVLINQQSILDQENDTPAVEEPQNLERAIRSLITNLDAPVDDAQRMDDNESIASIDSSDSHSNDSRPCSVKSSVSRVELVAPSPDDIRPAVVKSIENVIVLSKGTVKPKNSSTTSCKREQQQQQQQQQRPSVLQKHSTSTSNISTPSPQMPPPFHSPQYQNRLSIDSPLSPTTGDESLPACSNQHQASNGSRSRSSSTSDCVSYEQSTSKLNCNESPKSSVLKRSHDDSDDGNNPSAKRRNVIQSCGSLSPCISQLSDPESNLAEVLPNSFEALDQFLNKIEDATSALRGQRTVSEYELEGIMDEHSVQRGLLESIQADFNEISSNDEYTPPAFDKQYPTTTYNNNPQ